MDGGFSGNLNLREGIAPNGPASGDVPGGHVPLGQGRLCARSTTGLLGDDAFTIRHL
jgi:hypothetical protein